MNKKIILGVAAALAVAGGIAVIPMVATSAPPVCETSTALGSGRPLSRCPTTFRVDDHRQVTP